MSNTSKQGSLIFLSLLCFALADVRDGLGPFLGVYLQEQNWTPDEIGFVMTAGGLAELFCITPLGALADHTRHKRRLIAASVCLIVAGCGLVFVQSGAAAAGFSRILQSIAAAAIAPALTGITLGMVGQKGLPARLGRNEAWSHAGNASTAVLGGTVGYFFGIPGVFFVMAVMGALAVFSLARINPDHIDYAAARGLEPSDSPSRERPARNFRLLFVDKGLLAVAVTLFFFHLGNAALLPLLGQSAVARFSVNGAAYTAGTVVLAQATMIGMALWGAKVAQKKGYGWLFLLALLALPIRGCIAGLWESPWNIIPVQMLDGVGAGLLGVATPGIVARLLQGSGHINMGLGMVLTVQGVGASLSNTYGGLFAHHVSYSAAFLALAAAPCVGLAVFIAATRLLPSFAGTLKPTGAGRSE
ncbi:MFS transporter [uncultured Mailhella sp.]|uniref:MFS transporter n=1 Tax=uncultured Mailhella sp. TaxID=1981031 RepID=UPI0025D5C2EB|nr:MFS transporter [uncultured Mailhella sp.]